MGFVNPVILYLHGYREALMSSAGRRASKAWSGDYSNSPEEGNICSHYLSRLTVVHFFRSCECWSRDPRILCSG